jgi:hypothetical protein
VSASVGGGLSTERSSGLLVERRLFAESSAVSVRDERTSAVEEADSTGSPTEAAAVGVSGEREERAGSCARVCEGARITRACSSERSAE